ncbi:unnamed protein product [Caretta caretta]
MGEKEKDLAEEEVVEHLDREDVEDLATEEEEDEALAPEEDLEPEEDLTMEEDKEELSWSISRVEASWVQDVAEQIQFLHAISPMYFTAQKSGQDTLEPPCSKAALVERIAELTEELPLDSALSSILSSSQALHKTMAENLNIMLRSLLAMSHNTDVV